MRLTLPNDAGTWLAIHIEGHGTYTEKEGAILYLEKDSEGEWFVYAWGDIRKEEPTTCEREVYTYTMRDNRDTRYRGGKT